ncbi:MAG: PAS domain S-box protein, partial [Chloroflexota bacterium]
MLAWLYGRITTNALVEVEASKNVALAQVMSNFLWPDFAPFATTASDISVETLSEQPEIEAFYQALERQTEGLSVVKVKIYDKQGLTVFSTEKTEIGQDKRDNPGFRSALRGEMTSELTFRDTFSAFERTVEDRNVLSSHIPVQHNQNGEIEAIFEIYSDVTPLVGEIQQSQQTMIISTAIVLSLLYLVLFFIVRYANEIIQQQYLDRHKIENELKSRTQQHEAVSELSQRSLVGTDLSVLVNETVSLLTDILKVNYAGLFELDLTKDHLFLQFGSGWQKNIVGRLTMDVDVDTQIGYTILAQKPIIVEDALLEAKFKQIPLFADHDIASGITVPIQSQDRPFGVLGVFTNQPRSFTEDEIHFLQTIANILATSRVRKQTEFEIIQRNRELLALQMAGAAITSTLDLKLILDTVTKELADLLNVQACAISEWHQDDDTLILLADYGRDNWWETGNWNHNITKLADYPLTKQVLTDQIARQMTIDQLKTGLSELTYMQEADITTLLMLPLVYQKQVLGLAEIMDTQTLRYFDEQEIALAQLLANQAASAIQNARLYDQAQQEIVERKRIETQLQAYQAGLEETVDQRTKDLTRSNEKLLAEIFEREQAETALQKQEAFLRQVIDINPHYIFAKDREGHYTLANESFAKVYGATVEALIGHKDTEFSLDQTIVAQYREDDLMVMDSLQELFIAEERIEKDNGQVFWRETIKRPIIDETGEATQVLGIVTDITERKEAEELLRQSEARFRLLIEQAADAFFLTDLEDHNRIVDVNQQACLSLGYSYEELLTLTISDIEVDPDLEQYDRLSHKLARGEAITVRGVYQRKDGSRFPVEARIAHFERDGHMFELGLVRDISERKQAELELQQAKEVAETANRAKSEFLATMSHELRTPLNGILGYTQILHRNQDLTEEQRKAVTIMQQSGEHLLTLLNDILDLSKIEANRMELILSDFHLPDFLKNIVDIFRIRAREKNIEFVYEPSSYLVAVKGDEKRLRQVLINLLGNAVKFTSQGQVTLKVGYQGEKIRFQVDDTGVGIESDQIEEIFSPFRQVVQADEQIEGTGLGLPISQRLVSMMGGTLQIKSVSGQGSSFWFDLLLPKSKQWHHRTQTDEMVISGFEGVKRTVLIVDDNEKNRLILRDMLAAIGFQVIEA